MESLKLENQICFPLYVASKEIISRYKPFLDKLNLTYTQYITMMCMWECKTITVKDLGEKLFLDSGTLTPLLKKLEEKKYITRTRSKDDERVVIISVTDLGMKLEQDAKDVPNCISKCVNLTKEEAISLYTLLYKVIKG